MAKCTEDMMVRAFDIYHTQEKDINPLIEMGMNENSAKDTIKSYDKLLNGELHTRQVPIILVKVILETLYERKEKDKLSNVISALDKKYEFRYREYNELNQGARKIVDEYRKKIYGRMINKFFAYHGPQNLESFNYKGGYGVAQESKWKKPESVTGNEAWPIFTRV